MFKIIVSVILFFTSFLFIANVDASCSFNGDTSSSISNCINGTDVLEIDDAEIENGLIKDVILNWIRNIGGILALLAVISIVVGGGTMVISAGEEEQIKKGKDKIKWGIIGFLGVVSAGTLISIVVDLMFTI